MAGFFGFGAWLQALLGEFGIVGQMTILFVVFFVDAVLFPMLPEAFVLYFYSIVPTFDTRFSPRADLVLTASTILMVVLAAEVLANGFLYALVRWKRDRLPRRLQHAMNTWREFLVVRDERVILLNRVVPIMPFAGAFMAVSPWDPKRAMGFLVLGGALKYGALLVVVGAAGLVFDPSSTWKFTLALLAAILAMSVLSQLWVKRRLRQARAQAQAQRLAEQQPGPPP